ncbi:hypothetical protein BRM3_01635 [Brachybacterium huguangmaarense]|uniref:Uncharacterized protein n=1 Tax=Brachybacterium huguangmaarense TaxID=1652028 RepID=A0ABY6G1U2_9MICO|nr:hypothetical protein [Brachybacterium huguangmaarense]UYG17165.1 hypothetical protein BRM3_01635 [Brachybacterium huguangmaarense]
MPSSAVLEPVRPLHHLPRRDATATGVLRALGTGPMPVVAEASVVASTRLAADETAPASAAPAPAESVRSLRLRDLTTGGAAAAGSWTLAAHLGLLGTATGTFVVSVVSAILVALAADSLTGLRRMLLNTVRRARQAGVHRTRGPRSAGGGGASRDAREGAVPLLPR